MFTLKYKKHVATEYILCKNCNENTLKIGICIQNLNLNMFKFELDYKHKI